MMLTPRNVLLLLAAVFLVLTGLLLYGKGRINGRDTCNTNIAELNRQLGERDEALNAKDGQLSALRASLQRQRDTHVRMRVAAEAELSARAARITELTKAAAARQTHLRQEAQADEDCAVLRDLPVCAAVADRLWGGQAGSSTH